MDDVKELAAIETRIKTIEEKQKALEVDKENAIAKGSFMTASNSGNSDEKQALRYFGVPHVSKLLEVNVGHARFANVPAHLKHLVLELKRDVDVARMSQQILAGEPKDISEDRPAHVKGMLDSYFGKNVLGAKLKAFGTGNAGEGLEWVPTAISAQYIEEYELQRQVASKFRQINMPTNPFKLPVQTSVTKARIQAEGAGLTGTNFGTTDIEFDAIKLTEFYPLSEELNEDSAPDILGLARSEVVEAQIRAVEAAILNGDDSLAHMDFDIAGGAANLAEKAWKGLRKRALDNSANGSLVDFLSGAATLPKLRSMREAMKKHGVNERELVYLVSTKVYNQMLSLPEVTTVEKFGPMATILKGALAALDGIPIVISEYQRDTVHDSGVNEDGEDNDKSVAMLVNHRRFYWGVRRPIRVKAVMDPTPPNDQWLIASWWRGDFTGHAQSVDEVSVVLGHNIA